MMWSSVVAIFTSSPGLRNVIGLTSMPVQALRVSAASAPMPTQPSKVSESTAPRGAWTWSKLQLESKPSSSIRSHPSRH